MELSIYPSKTNIEKKLNPKSQNMSNFDNIFESSLKLSEIENKENEQTKKYDSLNSYNFDSINNNEHIRRKKGNIVNIKKKLTKEDLNNIPLPIFSCIYCSNDKIAFNHLINENLSNKYYLQTSIYDMKLLDKLIKTNPIIDRDNQNLPLIDIILKNTEFIRHYYNKNEISQIYSSEKMNKIFEFNDIKVSKNSINKLNYKLMRRRNKELPINKANSNKLFALFDYKPFFQKQNNNSTFTNDNITTNKNSITNTIGTPNTGLSLSLINNIINENTTNVNNINICFNPNNMMQSIMENIEKNEESECESEEKFLDILGVQSNLSRKIDKNKINFEEKNYDIWNPDITTITEEEEEEVKTIKNKNSFQDKYEKNVKQKINFVNAKKKLCKILINDKINNQNEKGVINRINYNYENVIIKKIKKNINIVTPYTNTNIKNRNLINFINIKNRRNVQIEPFLFKNNFPTKDYNNNIYLDKKIFTSRNNDFIHINNMQKGQRAKRNLLYLLKSKSGFSKNKRKNNIINSKKYISKSSLPLKDNLSNLIKSSLTSINFYDPNINFNSKIYKNMHINSNLSQRKDHAMNLEIDLNNKKLDTFSKNIKIANKTLLKEKSGFTSLPNLKNNNLSPIYNKIRAELNQKKKIRIKNNLRKINSYNFLQKKIVSLSKPSIRCGIFSDNK